MAILLSELYGKGILTNTGNKVGFVEDIILDFEDGKVSRLLLTKIDDLLAAKNTAEALSKNSVNFERVKSVSETIIIGSGK
ncbi:MAG: PRC-barrel domain-containing protein [Candidatus Micrarchaeaceae archaeon]